MAYTKNPTWVDGEGGTLITADALNHIEDGIAAAALPTPEFDGLTLRAYEVEPGVIEPVWGVADPGPVEALGSLYPKGSIPVVTGLVDVFIDGLPPGSTGDVLTVDPAEPLGLKWAAGGGINAQTGTTYTLVAADASGLLTLTNAAAITLTVPGSVFTAGQRVDVSVRGTGMATVVGSSCTVNPPPGRSLVSNGQRSAFTVLFITATEADIIGDMASA